MNTKERIIYESLKLFSQKGYEAVSTRMIARAVGISDTAIYKHFKSKQEIFDTIIEECKKRFQESRKINLDGIDWDKIEDMCMEMFHFQTSDEWIVMFRRLLVIEQFHNSEMSALYQGFFINIAVDGMAMIFEQLMAAGYMKKSNPRVQAMELYAPFFMYHTLQPDSPELLAELREHVTYFRNNNKTDLC